MTKYFGIETSCPHCGQPMPADVVRFGVRLTPIKARIFDLIQRQPGVSIAQIRAIAFDDRASANTVKAHVSQIRDMFAATEITIIGRSNYGYRIHRLGVDHDEHARRPADATSNVHVRSIRGERAG